jgi:hypothetical protein
LGGHGLMAGVSLGGNTWLTVVGATR